MPNDIISLASVRKTQIKNTKFYSKVEVLSNTPWLNDKKKVYFRESRCEFDVSDNKLPAKLKSNNARFRYAMYNLVARFLLQNLIEYRDAALKPEEKKQIDSNDIALGFSISSRRHEIINLLSRFHSIAEIIKIAKEDWEIEIAERQIEKIRHESIDQIAEMQREYSNNFSDVRLGYKKSRMELYAELLNSQKDYLERNKDTLKTSERNDVIRVIKELVESIRKEAEGDVLRIEGDVSVNIEHTINNQIQNQVLKYLPMNEITITRAASRLGKSPFTFLYRLQKSSYASLTGFLPKNSEMQGKPIVYQSTLNFDLDNVENLVESNRIETANRENKFRKLMESETDDVYVDYEEIKSINNTLLDKIKSLK